MKHERDSARLVASLRLGHVLVLVASVLIVFTWNSFTMLNDNVESRLATVESIVEHHSVQIDDSRFVHTSDKVRVNGHFYSEKPPLLAFLAAPIYAPIRALGFTLMNSTVAYFAIVFTLSGFSFLICLVCFYDALLRAGLRDGAATWMTAMLGLGTLCVSFNTALNNHSFPASWLFIGMYCVLRARDDQRPFWMWAAGCSFALAVGADTSTAIFVAGCGVYILLEPALRRRVLMVVAPCALVLAAGVGYNYAICGSLRPMQVTPEYFDYPGGIFAPGGEPLTGVSRNSIAFTLSYGSRLLFGANGFLLYSPLLLLAMVAAIVSIVRRRPLWKLAAAVLVTSAGYVAYYALYSKNFAGCSYSIRWFVAFVPILFFFAFPFLGVETANARSLKRWTKVAFGCAFAVSAPIALLGAVNPWSCGAPSIAANLQFWRMYLIDCGASLVLAAVIFYFYGILRASLQSQSANVDPMADISAPPAGVGRRWLASILLLAFVLRVGAAIALPNSAYFDEVFQSREQAHRLVFGYGAVPWEFRDAARNWVFPAFIAGVIRATGWLGAGSWGYSIAIDIVLAALSLTLVWVGFRWAYRVAGLPAAIVTGIACAVWYELIYFAPQALSDIVAVYALLPGLYFGYFAIAVDAGDSPATRASDAAVRPFGSSANRLFLSGLFLGLAVALRIQLAPAIVIAVLWLCRSKARGWLPILLGLAVPLAIFGTVDAFTWGFPFASYVHTITINMLHHKSNMYGTEPAGWYFAEIASRFGLLLLLAFAGARRSWFLTSIAASVLLTQTAFAHKEYRFVFAVVPILCILVGLAVASAWNHLGAREPASFRGRGLTRRIAPAVAVIVLASLIWGSWQKAEEMERPVASEPSHARRGLWHSASDHIAAFRELSTRNDVCGVGTVDFRAGYFYLHHDVPVDLIVEIEPRKLAASNYIESPKNWAQDIPEYRVQKCWGDDCLYRRDGSCAPMPGYSVTKLMREFNR
jgi:GPI mannosyltransferase 3